MPEHRRRHLSNVKSRVVKLGTQLLTDKQGQLDDPLMVRLLRAIGDLISGDDESEARLEQTADLVVEMAEQAAARGELDRQDDALPDGSFADLLDTLVLTAGPRMVRLRDRLLELMVERGWSGLVKMERVEPRPGSES